MIIAKLISQCDINSIYFTELSHNSANNSTFSRIMACDPNSIINGLYVRLPLQDVDIHDISDWGVCKQVAQYRIDDNCNNANARIFSVVQDFESSVLQLYKNTFNVCASKTQCHHIADTLLSGILKLGGAGGGAGAGAGGGNSCDVLTDNAGDINTQATLTLTLTPSQSQQDKDQTRVSTGATGANVLLKLSGVWETDKTFGITFKYVSVAASNTISE